jgi:phospholipase/lecithinase/hemolysin
MKKYRFMVVAIFTALVLSNAHAEESCKEQLIVFGDSLSDTGNILVASFGAFPPPVYADGRFTDGIGISDELVWVEYLADLLELDRPAARLSGESPPTNYAFGGAVTGGTPAVFEPALNPSPGSPVQGGAPLDDQIDLFLQDLQTQSVPPGSCGLNPQEALVVMWIGSNDVLLLNQDKFKDSLESIRASISTLITNAGTTRFLVANMPDVSKTPAYIDYDSYFISEEVLNVSPKELRKRVDKFNLKLDKTLDKLEAKNPNVTIYRFDAFSLLNDIIANPEDYNLNSATDIPLLNEESLFLDNDPEPSFNPGASWASLFWDGVHPSSRVHKIFADEACLVLNECNWIP